MDALKAIKSTFETGAFWASEDGKNVTLDDLPKLKLTDPVVRDAFEARSLMQVTDYAQAVIEEHGRPPVFDGELGPAMKRMIDAPRCRVPDFAPPPGVKFNFEDPDLKAIVEQMQADAGSRAFGDGNWRGCHDVGKFHSAAVRVDRRGIGAHLSPVFDEVLKLVQKSFAQIGLLFHFIDRETNRDLLTGQHWDGPINIEFTFVSRAPGWIGLAIIGQNQVCSSRIWCKFLSTYRPSNVIREWTTLIKHELGHNCGMGHFPGRFNVMNPGIIAGLPWEWSVRDSSTPWLKRRFGGEAVPVNGPKPDPPPPDRIEQRVLRLESGFDLLEEQVMHSAIQDTVQNFSIQNLTSRLSKLEKEKA